MYKVSNGVRTTHSQDGTIILDIERGQILRLNVTGSLIFDRLQRARTESQIVDDLIQEFQIPQEIAQTDVRQFLESLDQKGLVSSDASEIHS